MIHISRKILFTNRNNGFILELCFEKSMIHIIKFQLFYFRLSSSIINYQFMNKIKAKKIKLHNDKDDDVLVISEEYSRWLYDTYHRKKGKKGPFKGIHYW